MKLLEDLKREVQESYVLVEVKKKKQNIDWTAIADAAVAIEKTIEDKQADFDRAKAEMEFCDRAMSLVATLKDSHFRLNTANPRPFITNGLKLSLIDGKVYVRAVAKEVKGMNILSAEVEESYSSLSLGDEVISIDGKPPLELAESMEKYVSASSDSFRKSEAVSSLSTRNFLYPTKNVSTYEVKRSGKTTLVKLPYFYGSSDNSYNYTKSDAGSFYLHSLNIAPLTNVRLKWLESEGRFDLKSALEWIGHNFTRAPNEMIGGKTWYEFKGGAAIKEEPVIRTGIYIDNKGTSFGILQLFSFSQPALMSENGDVQLFSSVLHDALAIMKEKKLPLILDLRYNNGGISGNANLLFKAVAKPGTYTAPTFGARVTESLQKILENFPNAMLPTNSNAVEDIREKIRHASLSEEYVYEDRIPITVEEDSGFAMPVFALVTENCVSACDIAAHLLQTHKAATLIGTQTNGTGAGFLGGALADVSIDRSVTTRIPNIFFGRFVGVNSAVGSIEEISKLNLENEPIVADIKYTETLTEDYQNNSTGWLKKTSEVYHQQKIKSPLQTLVGAILDATETRPPSTKSADDNTTQPIIRPFTRSDDTPTSPTAQ